MRTQRNGRLQVAFSKAAQNLLTIIPLPASLPSVQTSAEILRGLAQHNTQPYGLIYSFVCWARVLFRWQHNIAAAILGDQNAYCCHSCFFSDTTLCQSVSFICRKHKKRLVFAGSRYLFICRAHWALVYCSAVRWNDFALSDGELHSKQ
jgi:hypothetical protein